MTRISSTIINCPKCHQDFMSNYYASINTFMDSELIEKVLRKDFGLTCPHCKTNIDFQYTLLINCPKGFLHLNTGLKLEEIIRQLLEFEIIDIQGNIISPLLHSSKTQNTAVNLKEATDKDIAAIIQRYNS